MGTAPIVRETHEAFASELDPGQQSGLISWLSFTGTFAGVRRGITHAIKAGKGPFKNLSVGGEHLHHYMWGIGLLAGVGAVAVKGDERLRRHPATAVAYGVGLALIMDEFALLLDLKDVYWAKQGRISVDLAVTGKLGGGQLLRRPPRHPQGRRPPAPGPGRPAAVGPPAPDNGGIAAPARPRQRGREALNRERPRTPGPG